MHALLIASIMAISEYDSYNLSLCLLCSETWDMGYVVEGWVKGCGNLVKGGVQGKYELKLK